MKKLTFKGVVKTLQNAALDGSIVYGGRLGYRIVNKQVGSILPAAIPMQIHGAVVGSIGVILADLLLPQKFSRLAGAGMAGEVIDEFVSPYLEPTLVNAGLVYPKLTAPAPTTTTATSGYSRARGYARVSGYASVRPSMGSLAGQFM